MALVEYLDKAIRAAGVPIVSVSVGREGDRATWRVSPESPQDKAQPVIDAFVLPSPSAVMEDDAQRETSRKELRALALGLWECIPSPKLTRAQLAARVVEIYKSL